MYLHKTRLPMKQKLRVLLPLLLLIAGGFFYFRWAGHSNADGSLRLSGNIEITDAQISFKISGKLDKRLIEEGEFVRAGQPLARLEKTDQKIAVSQAEANLAYARSVVAELEAGSRSQEIEAARAEKDRAVAAEKTSRVQLQQAKADYERYQTLYAEGGVSRRMFETYSTAYATAQHAAEEVRSRIKAAQEQLDLRTAGPRKETIDQAKAKLNLAESALNQALQQQSYTELLAPFDGVVLSTSADTGEYLNPSSPVLTLGKLNAPWLRAYINEKDLGRLHLQQKAVITTDSFPGKTYQGTVSYINSQAEFTPKSVQTFEERSKLMYRIKIDLENPNNELKQGMPADAVIAPAGG